MNAFQSDRLNRLEGAELLRWVLPPPSSDRRSRWSGPGIDATLKDRADPSASAPNRRAGNQPRVDDAQRLVCSKGQRESRRQQGEGSSDSSRKSILAAGPTIYWPATQSQEEVTVRLLPATDRLFFFVVQGGAEQEENSS